MLVPVTETGGNWASARDLAPSQSVSLQAAFHSSQIFSWNFLLEVQEVFEKKLEEVKVCSEVLHFIKADSAKLKLQ